MAKYKEREYGLGDPGKPGRPKATPVDEETRSAIIKDGGCPQCGCFEVMQINVKIENTLLTGGKGDGMYLGCPACPWASPMAIVASKQ